MLAASARLRTVKSSYFPVKFRKAASSATPVKPGKQFNATSFLLMTALKACAQRKDLYQLYKIHAVIRNGGLLQKNAYLGNTLISMYAKCGALAKAREVFDELPARNVVSWSALIAGFAQHDRGKEALGCFQQMRLEGPSANAITYACTLKACGIAQDIDMGETIHNEIDNQGLLEKHVSLGNALVDMYAKCGALTKARKVLDELPVQDTVSWNALIAGYAQHGCGKEALGCFQQMQSDCLSPTEITYACTLKACGITRDIDMGKKIHNEIASQGLLDKHVLLGGALVDMYAKCGVLARAWKVLHELPVRNVVSWSALIAGYAQHDCGKEALVSFQQMRSEGLSPDAITYACILKACGITQDVDMGERIHDEIASGGLLEKHVLLGSALVDMYAKCGVLTKAQNVLYELRVRNVAAWNALIAGYSQQGQGQVALGCFRRMQSEGFSPDEVSWNALIGGYAQQGLAEEALDCFHWMQREGTSPTSITFVSMLNACSHSGLVDEGQMIFNCMKKKYGILLDKEHYSCMVDLFGRARRFDKAMQLINMMPSSSWPLVWYTLLGACQKWGNVGLGRLAFKHVVELAKCDAASYILMSNIYAAADMQEEEQNIEPIRIGNGVRTSSQGVAAELVQVESL